MIANFGPYAPRVAEDAWIAPTATVIGQVSVGALTGIWYNAVIRADDAAILVASRSNVQDCCVLHADPGMPLSIGSGVTIGHNATVHSCTVGDDVLIGMGATVLNGAIIGSESLIAAGALVPEGFVVPPRTLVAGLPAKIRRSLADDEVDKIRQNAANYVRLSDMHRQTFAAGAR